MINNPNRTVAVLTPLVFAPAAGFISALAAKYGLDIDGGSLQAIFITGATVAVAKSALWMKGWQKHEQREADGLEGAPGTAAGEPFVEDLEDPTQTEAPDDFQPDDEEDLAADEDDELTALAGAARE